jgi:hypothetical protein
MATFEKRSEALPANADRLGRSRLENIHQEKNHFGGKSIPGTHRKR